MAYYQLEDGSVYTAAQFKHQWPGGKIPSPEARRLLGIKKITKKQYDDIRLGHLPKRHYRTTKKGERIYDHRKNQRHGRKGRSSCGGPRQLENRDIQNPYLSFDRRELVRQTKKYNLYIFYRKGSIVGWNIVPRSSSAPTRYYVSRSYIEDMKGVKFPRGVTKKDFEISTQSREGSKLRLEEYSEGKWFVYTKGTYSWLVGHIVAVNNKYWAESGEGSPKSLGYFPSLAKATTAIEDHLTKSRSRDPFQPSKTIAYRARTALRAAGIEGQKTRFKGRKSEHTYQIWSISTKNGQTILTIHIPNVSRRQAILNAVRNRAGLKAQWIDESEKGVGSGRWVKYRLSLSKLNPSPSKTSCGVNTKAVTRKMKPVKRKKKTNGAIKTRAGRKNPSHRRGSLTDARAAAKRRLESMPFGTVVMVGQWLDTGKYEAKTGGGMNWKHKYFMPVEQWTSVPFKTKPGKKMVRKAIPQVKRKNSSKKTRKNPPPLPSTVIPAYGRDYKTAIEAKASWNAGKDWIIADMSSPWNGKPISKRDFPKGTSVTLRFGKLRKTTRVTN